MTKTFTRDGIEYRRFTMDVPEALYQLMEQTWGRYGKSEEIANILIGVLTGVDHYDHELAALTQKYDQVRAAQASLLEYRIQEKQALALGIEKVQQVLYEKQTAAAIATEAAPDPVDREKAFAEAETFLAADFSTDSYDVTAPVAGVWVKHYTGRANQHLAGLGVEYRVTPAWVEGVMNQIKVRTLEAIPRLGTQIPDEEVPPLVELLGKTDRYEITPAERKVLEAVYQTAPPGLYPAHVDDYLRLRAVEIRRGG